MLLEEKIKSWRIAKRVAELLKWPCSWEYQGLENISDGNLFGKGKCLQVFILYLFWEVEPLCGDNVGVYRDLKALSWTYLSSLSWERAQSSEVIKGTEEVTACWQTPCAWALDEWLQTAALLPARTGLSLTVPDGAGIPTGASLLPVCCFGILQLAR